MIKRSYFTTFEKREEQFRKSVHALLPRKHAGLAVFLKDMSDIINGIHAIPSVQLSYISSNPRDSLPYTFVRDLLSVSAIQLNSGNTDIVKDAIDVFGIESLLSQKIHSLSGGEVVKLSLARAYILSSISDKIVVSSPLVWLSKKNMPLFDEMAESYILKNKYVDILYMEDEDDDSAAPLMQRSEIEFSIDINGLVVLLAEDGEESESYGRVVFNNYNNSIKSPCLIKGDNGAGKSLLAKALSRSIKYYGVADVIHNGNRGRARLIFQDVIVQAMMRPFSVLLNDYDDEVKKEILEIYDEIQCEMVRICSVAYKINADFGCDDLAEKTLVQYKIIMVSIRIAGRPLSLILDEPDWGLTKKNSVAFMGAVIDVAHKKNIPIFIISHRTWITDFANSIVNIEKIKGGEFEPGFCVDIK